MIGAILRIFAGIYMLILFGLMIFSDYKLDNENMFTALFLWIYFMSYEPINKE